MSRAMALLLVALASLGCASYGGPRVSQEKIAQVKEGQTTRAQVIEILGSPMTSTLTSDGKEVFMYYSGTARSSAQNFIPVVNLVQSKVNMDTQSINVLFNKDGIVEKMTATNSKSDVKYGIATE